jgi:LacI family transcriptional regulator
MGRAMAGPRVRLKDIADSTGFSVNTVSLALRDSPRIPEDTRRRIREAAEALDYLPNQVAKSLVSRETRTIGLVLTDVTNPVLTRVAQAVELMLAARGYATLFATSNNDPAEEVRVLETFRARQVDGMLVYPRSHGRLEHIRRLRQANHPVVLLVGDPDSGLDAVCIDERRGAYKATRHLVDIGHRRIALIDSSRALGNLEKSEGYRQALADSGIAFAPELVADPQGHSVAHGYWAFSHVLAAAERPTAVLAANDSLALGGLRWCQSRGLRVPRDLAVFGFDNIEFGEYAATPLSSVDYPVETVARLAVQRLLELIGAGGDLPPPRVTMIDPDLIVRESSIGRRDRP